MFVIFSGNVDTFVLLSKKNWKMIRNVILDNTRSDITIEKRTNINMIYACCTFLDTLVGLLITDTAPLLNIYFVKHLVTKHFTVAFVL